MSWQIAPTDNLMSVRITVNDLRIKPHKDVQMIIHHRKSADSDREDVRQMREPLFDPALADGISSGVTEQLPAAHAASDAVVPTSDGKIHELSASDRDQ